MHPVHCVCEKRITTTTTTKRFCPHCDEEVHENAVRRAYQLDGEKFQIVPPEALEPDPAEDLKGITVLEFTGVEEVDPAWHAEERWLGSGDDELESNQYRLLRRALESQKAVAVCRVWTRKKRPQIGIVEPRGRLLLLTLLHYQAEMVPQSDIPYPREPHVEDEAELAALESLIAANRRPFDHGAYRDGYPLQVVAAVDLSLEDSGVHPMPLAEIIEISSRRTGTKDGEGE